MNFNDMKLTTENTENTESDTPETDKAIKYWPSENAELVDANFARKLERERDEAREDLEFRRELYAILTERLRRIKRERDETRQLLASAQNALDAIHLGVGSWISKMKQSK